MEKLRRYSANVYHEGNPVPVEEWIYLASDLEERRKQAREKVKQAMRNALGTSYHDNDWLDPLAARIDAICFGEEGETNEY